MKYNVGDLIACEDRVGLIINVKTDLLGNSSYQVEWQCYHSDRYKYVNNLTETNINKILVLKNLNKHLPVIK